MFEISFNYPFLLKAIPFVKQRIYGKLVIGSTPVKASSKLNRIVCFGIRRSFAFVLSQPGLKNADLAVKKNLLINKALFAAAFQSSEPISTTIYEQYIEYLRTKKYPNKTRLEKHHIVPVHAGGSNDSFNIIKISIPDHVRAHRYRYIAYGQAGDKLAYIFRQNDSAEAALLRSQLAMQARLEKGQLERFKDSKAQCLLGKLGGKKGGIANTAAQYEARSIVGKKHGKAVGISNQATRLKQLIQQEWLWEHKNGVTVKTVPSKSFKEICDQLQKAVPNTITNSGSFLKVLYGERLQMYGWKLVSSFTGRNKESEI